MKVVFLDFDGVVMTAASYQSGPRVRKPGSSDEDHAWSRLDPELVANVSELCRAAGADIVLSTAWRSMYNGLALERALRRRGLADEVRVIGQTPDLTRTAGGLYRPVPRNDEVRAWLDENRPGWTARDVLVLDDEDHAWSAPLRARWVRSSFTDGGFTRDHLARALRLFGLVPA